MDSKRLHKKLKIDTNTDSLIPLLLDLFAKGDSLTKSEVVSFMAYVHKDFGFRRVGLLIETLSRHLANHVDDPYPSVDAAGVEIGENDSPELKYRKAIANFLADYGRDSNLAFDTLVLMSASKLKQTRYDEYFANAVFNCIVREIATNVLTQWGLNDVKDTIFYLENVNKAISEVCLYKYIPNYRYSLISNRWGNS